MLPRYQRATAAAAGTEAAKVAAAAAFATAGDFSDDVL